MKLLDGLKKLFLEPQAEPVRALPPGDPLAAALEALGAVFDPELGVDIVSMGLIRKLSLDDRRLHVLMTLSTPGCPVGPAIVGEATDALRDAGFDPTVELTFEPPWTPEDMSPEAQSQVKL